MKNFTLITDIIEATEKRQSGDLIKAVRAVQALPILNQYYLIKGLKMSNKEVAFYQMFAQERKHCLPLVINLLSELYIETDDDPAWLGMGNLEDYITAINAL